MSPIVNTSYIEQYSESFLKAMLDYSPKLIAAFCFYLLGYGLLG